MMRLCRLLLPSHPLTPHPQPHPPRTVLLVNNVKILGKEALMPPLTDVDIININKIARNHSRQNVFKLLANSLAPSIYGHEQIKQGLLALLLGGEEKNLRRGGHIRGCVSNPSMGGGV